MAEVIIVGIGNPYRGDDAAGWAVIDALTEALRGNDSIHLSKQRGDIAELLDIFSKYSKVFLVDASFAHNSMGTWKRIDVHLEPLPEERQQTSTPAGNSRHSTAAVLAWLARDSLKLWSQAGWI